MKHSKNTNSLKASNPGTVMLSVWRCMTIYITLLVVIIVLHYGLYVLNDWYSNKSLLAMTGLIVTEALLLPLLNVAAMCYFFSRLLNRRQLMVAMFVLMLLYLFAVQPIKGMYLTKDIFTALMMIVLISLPTLILLLVWKTQPEWIKHPRRVFVTVGICVLFQFLLSYFYLPWQISGSDAVNLLLSGNVIMQFLLFFSLPYSLIQLLPLWLGSRSATNKKK